MFCDLSPYQSRRCKEIIEGKVENSENVRGLIEFIDAKFKARAISAFYGAGRDSAWLKIVLRFDKDAAKSPIKSASSATLPARRFARN